MTLPMPVRSPPVRTRGEACEMVHLPGHYNLIVDAVWHDVDCADCKAAITRGEMIGLRPSAPPLPHLFMVICRGCVDRELARRCAWIRDELADAIAAEDARFVKSGLG